MRSTEKICNGVRNVRNALPNVCLTSEIGTRCVSDTFNCCKFANRAPVCLSETSETSEIGVSAKFSGVRNVRGVCKTLGFGPNRTSTFGPLRTHFGQRSEREMSRANQQASMRINGLKSNGDSNGAPTSTHGGEYIKRARRRRLDLKTLHGTLRDSARVYRELPEGRVTIPE